MLVTFDANILYPDPLLKNAHAIVVRDSAERLGYQVTLTQVVFTEAVNHRTEAVTKAVSRLKSAVGHTQQLGMATTPTIPVVSEITNAIKAYESDLAEIFPEQNRLGYPSTSHAEMVRRATEKRRPMLDQDKGYRDTLIWLSILERLADDPQKVVLISNDNGFRKSDQSNELHPDLVSDLEQRGLNPDAVILYRSLEAFTSSYIKPQLESLEEIKVLIENSSIPTSETLADEVGILLTETLYGDDLMDWDLGLDDVLSLESDVVEDAVLDGVEDVKLLPGGDIFVRSSWRGDLAIEAQLWGYRNEFVHRPINAVIDLVLRPDTFELHGMDVVGYEVSASDMY